MKLTVSFIIFLLISLGISAFDAYLNLKYPVTVYSEENPIARWILKYSDLNVLIALKLFGTSLVGAFLTALFCFYRRIGWLVAFVLALFQCFVLYYLVT